MIDLVIYQPGSTCPQCTVVGGVPCNYGFGAPTLEAYLKELNAARPEGSPEFVVMPYSEVKPLMDKAGREKYIKPWEEITQKQFMYFLEILPPCDWRNGHFFEIFHLSERTTGNIALHCARVGSRYFSAQRDVSTGYEVLRKELLTQIPELDLRRL